MMRYYLVEKVTRTEGGGFEPTREIVCAIEADSLMDAANMQNLEFDFSQDNLVSGIFKDNQGKCFKIWPIKILKKSEHLDL